MCVRVLVCDPACVISIRVAQAVLDIVLGGLGWLAVTPIPLMGMHAWSRTMANGRFVVRSHAGVSVLLRKPLLPFETVGTGPEDWLSR